MTPPPFASALVGGLPVDRLLWQRGTRPARISKYATGLAALRPDLPDVPWRRTLRRHFRDATVVGSAGTGTHHHPTSHPGDIVRLTARTPTRRTSGIAAVAVLLAGLLVPLTAPASAGPSTATAAPAPARAGVTTGLDTSAADAVAAEAAADDLVGDIVFSGRAAPSRAR